MLSDFPRSSRTAPTRAPHQTISQRHPRKHQPNVHNPTQSPSAPHPIRNPSHHPTGSPITQYPTNCTTKPRMSISHSPQRPRSRNLQPIEELKHRRHIQQRHRRPNHPRIPRKRPRNPLAPVPTAPPPSPPIAPAPSKIPAHPAAAASSGSFRPIPCPTRTAVAAEIANGTINVKLAQFKAISCPASGKAPIAPIKNVTIPKIEISTKICPPAGAPSRASRHTRALSNRRVIVLSPYVMPPVHPQHHPHHESRQIKPRQCRRKPRTIHPHRRDAEPPPRSAHKSATNRRTHSKHSPKPAPPRSAEHG